MDAPIHIGPAGWSYKDWEGVVYPRPHPRGFDPLSYLALYFDALEVNTTFYGPQNARVAREWSSRVAHNPRFLFTAKLHRRFTHERGSAFTRAEVKAARATFDALFDDGRLGAVLLQFPWSFKREEASREWLRDVLDAFAALPRVVEVRHASWDVPEFFAELREAGVGFVNVDQPRFEKSLPPSARSTAQVAYVRVHGRNFKDWFRQKATRDQRYDYLYRAEELLPWARRAQDLATNARTRTVFVVTNNHFRGQAIANGVMLRSMVEGHPVPAPPPVVAAFPEALRPFVLPQGDADARPPL